MNEVIKGETGQNTGQQTAGQGYQSYGQGIGQSGQGFKRHVAYKFKIGQIIAGNQIFDQDKLNFIEINNKKVFRVNIIANIIDKYIQEGEKHYGTVTIDDATGQLKVKFFGDEIEKIKELNQGDTVLVVGLLRSWNSEVYITSEIIKKKDSRYLLVRKLEVDLEQPKVLDKDKIAELKDKIVEMVKKAEAGGGIDTEKIILELKEPPEIINNEVKKLLEDGVIYEPRPARLRYLG